MSLSDYQKRQLTQALGSKSLADKIVEELGVTTDEIADGAVETAKIADGNVTAAKLADNAVETAKILDANVTMPKLEEQVLRSVDVTVSTGEILALNAVPKDILVAPGANKAIVPVQAVLMLDYNSAAYAGIAAGEDLAFKYTDASGTALMTVETDPFLTATADAVRVVEPNFAVAMTPVANAKIVLHLLSGEITTGNSPLKIRLYYRVVPTVL